MILGIDTLTPCTQIGVGTVVKLFPASTTGQAEALMGCIAATLDAAGARYSDLTSVMVLTGPGSFTGLRVGLSAAHGIAQGLDIPIYGVTVPDAFAATAANDCDHMLLIDSRRSDLAMATRRAAESTFSDLVEMEITDIERELTQHPWCLLGNGILRLSQITQDNSTVLHVNLGLESVMRWHQESYPTVKSGYKNINATPFYLRPPDITISSKKFEHQSLYNQTN